MNSNVPSYLKVDQLLHGYDSGHRQISSSRRFNGQEKQILLRLSDRSMETKDLPENGYLTGYPLEDEKVYILARTWPAPEMKRPGCVWTHSLAIPFTALAQIQDISQLLKLFQRPKNSKSFRNYDEPLKLEIKANFSNLNIEKALAEELLLSLYANPDESVVIENHGVRFLEETVCAVWSQQWPRLRRNFKFCTQTTRDRSTSNIEFDLQVKPKGSGSFSNWPMSGAMENTNELRSGEWLATCLRDLSTLEHPLRDFLRQTASDIEGGRDRFAELCELFDLLRQERNDRKSNERVLDYVSNRLSKGEGMLLRKKVLSTMFQRVDSLDDRNLLALLPHFDMHGLSLDDRSRKKLAKRLWNIDPSIFLDENTSIGIRDELNFILKELSFNELRQLMKSNSSMIKRVIPLRRDVLGLPEFWIDEGSIGDFDQIIDGLSFDEKISALSAIIDADRSDLFHRLVPIFGIQMTLNAALNRRFNSSIAKLVEMALNEVTDPTSVIEDQMALATKKLSKQILKIFAKHLKPNHFSTSIETYDPWADAWVKSTGKLSSTDTDYMHVFFFQRALRLKKDQAVPLLSIAFDPLLDSILGGSLSYENKWNLSDGLEAAVWFDWSYEGRCMRTIASYILKQDVTEEQFNRISSSRVTKRELFRILESNWKGRQFLNKFQLSG